MATNTNTFNIGKDVSVVYIGAFGRVDFSQVTGWEAKPITKTVKINPLNGLPIALDIPDGWEFSFTIERNGPAADDLHSNKEAAFWNGIKLPVETMYAYINEPDGSTSAWQFNNCVAHLAEAGSWSQEKAVTQRWTGFASQRLRVS